jgi:hypothetical protein
MSSCSTLFLVSEVIFSGYVADEIGMVALIKIPRLVKFPDATSEFSTDERRMFERTPAQGQVKGHRMDHTIPARQNPRLDMNLRDVSAGGLAAVAATPLQEGELVSVGLRQGWDACGRVIRCHPSPLGYEVAIEFDQRRAA